jgi:hypothetical protein
MECVPLTRSWSSISGNIWIARMLIGYNKTTFKGLGIFSKAAVDGYTFAIGV